MSASSNPYKFVLKLKEKGLSKFTEIFLRKIEQNIDLIINFSKKFRAWRKFDAVQESKMLQWNLLFNKYKRYIIRMAKSRKI